MDTLQKEIINRIDSLIKNSGMNANEFAKKIGKRPGIVTDWRTGRSFPSLEVLFDICKLLNCNFYDIIPETYVTSHSSQSFNVKIGSSEHTLISYFRGMNPDDQDELLMIAEMKFRKEKKLLDAKLSTSQTDDMLA